MAKHKKLTALQLENLRDTIAQLEAPLKLEELRVEVEEFFERHPTHDCRAIVPRTMEMYLNKFLRIMGEKKDE